MVRKVLLAAVFTASCVWATPASASFISFDPDGGGTAVPISIDLFDLLPGNVLTINAGAAGIAGGGPVTSLFQANLSAADSSGTGFIDYSNGQLNPDGTRTFFTFVAGIPEVITSVVGPTVTFDFDATRAAAAPTGDNYFYIYATTVDQVGNDLSGICFTCGALILQGVFLDTAGFSNTFSEDVDNTPTLFDDFGADNYAGDMSLAGGGSLNADIQITTVLNAWFPNLLVGQTVQWSADTENNLPFDKVNPSACFNRDGLGAVALCSDAGQYAGAGNANTTRGIVPGNGLSTDIMLQSDTALDFTATPTAVPEPATLTLFGTGLLAAVLHRRRQNKARS
jgi:hypothetical protein